MVSTLTPSVLSAVSTRGSAASLALISVLVLVVLLVQKEGVAAASDPQERTLSQSLNVIILPLLIAITFDIVIELLGSFA